MEKLGYFISEAPVAFLVVWFGIRLVHIRRYRNKEPIYSEKDAHLLFHCFTHRTKTTKFYLKLFLAAVAAAVVGFIEAIVLAPFGAAILSCALILTSSAIVYCMLMTE